MRASKPSILLSMAVLIAALVGSCFFYGVKVKADVQSVFALCPPESPILITVHNNTFKRLVRVHVQLEGWRNGISEDILKNNSYLFEKVLKPLSSDHECFRDDSVSPPQIKVAPNERYDMNHALDDIGKSNKKTKGVYIVVKNFIPEFY